VRIYDAGMESARQDVEELISCVGAVLGPRVGEVIRDLLAVYDAELPELRGDDRLVGLLTASIEENCATGLHMFQHRIDMAHAEAPPAAVEYARKAAQHGLSPAALLRGYRLGQARFLQWCGREMRNQTADTDLVAAATLRLIELNFAYIDRVSEQVVSVYEQERERWLRSRSAARTAQVRAILAGENVEVAAAEAALGHRLRQHHLGVVAWIQDTERVDDGLVRLEREVAALADWIGADGPPLVVPVDDTSTWVWLPLGGRADVAPARLERPPGERNVRFAVGTPRSGVAGFRRTHRQALRAHSVAVAAGDAGGPVTPFCRVAPIASMCADLGETRAWVGETLGSLAVDDDRHARLRETLHEFLATGGSYTATADRLTMHKSTVQYRIGKARDLLGVSLDEDRLHVEVALLACRWFGPAVLHQPDQPS
jgi:hypothetical protein